MTPITYKEAEITTHGRITRAPAAATHIDHCCQADHRKTTARRASPSPSRNLIAPAPRHSAGELSLENIIFDPIVMAEDPQRRTKDTVPPRNPPILLVVAVLFLLRCVEFAISASRNPDHVFFIPVPRGKEHGGRIHVGAAVPAPPLRTGVPFAANATRHESGCSGEPRSPSAPMTESPRAKLAAATSLLPP